MRSRFLLPLTILTITFTFLLISCSSGPKAPEMGTPAFYWLAAKESWASGDYMKTADNLDRAMRGSKDHESEARPWSLVLTAGLAKGYIELADTFENGARVNKTNPAAFRKQTSDYRRFARGLALQMTERYRQFEDVKDDPVSLSFTFPSGTQALPPLMTRIGSGMLPAPVDLETAQRAVLQRNVILATARAAGAAEDSSKASQIFRDGEVKVPRPQFMFALAQFLHEISELFGPKKLDEPNMMQLLAEEASHAIKGVPDSKEVKTLNEKIQKALKPAKKAG
jgi:hypothetical protein